MSNSSHECVVDTVYHLTTSDRLALLLGGMRADVVSQNRSSPKWLSFERALDEARPDWVANKGISRQSSVYAHATLELAVGVFGRCTDILSRRDQHLAVVALNIDPADVYVADAFMLGEGLSPTRYWETLITLEAFRRYYTVHVDEYGQSSTVLEDAPASIRFAEYFMPEVLIPRDVAPEDMMVFVESTYPLREGVNW